MFGIHLLPNEIASTEIEIISKNYPNDVKECKIQLFMAYLRQGACNWKKVVEALEKSNYPHIAQKVKQNFYRTNSLASFFSKR